MLSVAEARTRITSALAPVANETVSPPDAAGRALAADAVAQLTQPPFDVSAMDGYAVRAIEASAGARLTVSGSIPAGASAPQPLAPRCAMRIFTGAPVPPGADAIVIQEDTSRDGNTVTINEAAIAGKHIRRAGLDFRAGTTLLSAPRALSAVDASLLAAAGVSSVAVRRRPRIAILATGDELAPPGTRPGPGQIIASTGVAIAALVREWGGEALDLGIARDDRETIRRAAARVRDADMLVTLGGASVGEHDLVRDALQPEGLTLDFWKIAMRPGKPMMFGRWGATAFLGLPGNPVSALVCTHLFLRPAVERLLGFEGGAPPMLRVRLGCDLAANDTREDYLRACLSGDAAGDLAATPLAVQDSSMLSALAQADCLLVRPPHAPEARAGDWAFALPLRATRSSPF